MYNVNVGGEKVLIDTTRINNGIDKFISINETYSFGEEYLKAAHIEKLDNVEIKGKITKLNYDDYYLDLKISGVAVMLCAVTLKPLDYPFSINLKGSFQEFANEIDKNLRKNYNTIDILPIIWENILVEIPYRVVSEDAENLLKSGDGWNLVSDAEKIHPELSKLKDLL